MDHLLLTFWDLIEEQNIIFLSDIAGLVIWFFIKYFLFFNFIFVDDSFVNVFAYGKHLSGLQMRSVGEYPSGSESLGVNVYLNEIYRCN